MKRLPIRFFLLCLPLLALPHPSHAASQTRACIAVQAAGLSLAERHAAAKASAEAALDPARQCGDGVVRVMADPDSEGLPLQLQDNRDEPVSAPAQNSGRADSPCAAHDGCVTGALPVLPAAALARYAHAAAMVSTATFAGAFTRFPALP